MTDENKVRARILSVAQMHFFRLGFSKVTMSEIADELGMSKKTLYAHFPGKEELLSAIVDRAQAEVAENIDALVGDEKMDFVEKLKSVMREGAVFYSKFHQNFLLDIQKNAPGVWQMCDQFRKERMRANIVELIKQGMKAGYFRRDVHPTVIMMMQSAAMQALTTSDALALLPLSSTEVFDTIHRVIFEGILTGEARLRAIHRSNEHQQEERIYG